MKNNALSVANNTTVSDHSKKREYSPDDLLTEAEAADALTLSVGTLRNWRCLRRGPIFRKVGLRCVRYRRGDLETFQLIVTNTSTAP